MEKLTRGDAILSYFTYIRKKWGQEGLEQMFEDTKVPENLTAKEFYPDEEMIKVLDWIKDEHGEKALEEGGRFVVKNLGIIAWLVRLANMKFIMKRFEKNYKELYTFGRIETDTSQENKATLRMYDVYSGPSRCIAWKGVSKGALELTNTKGTAKKTKCVGKGDDCCEYTFEW